MGLKARKNWIAVVAAIVLCVGLLALLPLAGRSATAQQPTDFALTISDGGLPPAGGTTTIVVSIEPETSAIAAVGALVEYDAAIVQPTACESLVGLGACNIDVEGTINVQTVDPAGWANPTELFSVTFTALALSEDLPVSVQVDSAFDIGGERIAGNVDGGTVTLDLNGDVDCDNVRTVGDALVIAQYVVGIRVEGSCPLGDPTVEIDLTTADANGDGVLDIGDALQVARCTVGLLTCD